MSVEITVVSQCRVGLAPTVSFGRNDGGSGRHGCRHGAGVAVGRDGGVPGLTGGDHGMKMAQDRGSDDALRLGWLELVVLPGGQVPISGCVLDLLAVSVFRTIGLLAR